MNIKTILLLPHAGHRDRVLAPHAPSCRRVAPGSLLSWGTLVGEPGDVRHHVAHAGSCPVDQCVHLPLARDGAEVCEGTDRAGRVLGVLVIGLEVRVRAASMAFEIALLLGLKPGMERATALDRLRSIVAPLGTLVLLDADGKDVSP